MGSASKAWVGLRAIPSRDLAWIGAIVALLVFAHVSAWAWLGVCGLMLFVWRMSRSMCALSWLGASALERLCLGWLGMGGLLVIALDTWYLWIGSIAPWTVYLIGIMVYFLMLILARERRPLSVCVDWREPWLGCVVSVVANGALLWLLLLVRTDESVVSPWNLLGWQPFVLFGIALLGAMQSAWARKDDIPIFVWMLATFVGVSVSAIVYGIGFGFDPFLHRAAEQAMAQTGVVEPVRLLYSGQYVLVTALHWLTTIPVRVIDIWLVPILAALWLPLIATIGFEKGWHVSRRSARMWWVLLLTIPFMLATFTVPFTITYVMILGGMVAFPWFWQLERWAWLAVCVGYSTLAFIHPLIAVPFFLFLVGGKWAKGSTRRWIAVASLVAVSVPCMVVINQGADIHLGNLWEQRQLFLNLFHSPYWDPYPYIPWQLQVLYGWRYWFPMIVSIGVVIGCMWKWRTVQAKAYFGFTLGLLGATWATSTLFVLPGIIAHEQGEFALRILQTLYVFALPFFAYAVMRFTEGRTLALQIGFAIGATGLVVASWFFSYPQYNLKYPFYSPSVGQADVDLVHRVDQESDGKKHVVLSHQMLSAAAVQEFGFAHTYRLGEESVLWYAIPTGGSLYALYTDTLYQGPNREAYRVIAERLGVERIYFVADSYWVYADWLVKALGKEADGVFKVGESTVYSFNF